MSTDEYSQPPKGAQLSFVRLVRMSWSSLKHQSLASILQLVTIAATTAFLVFVLGQISLVSLTADLPDTTYPEGKMEQLVWVLIISLLVCTISNITNMLLSVTKRFREIGTMKCIGAFDNTILRLFLIEAMMLGGLGAVIGSFMGGLISGIAALIEFGNLVFRTSLLPEMIGWMFLALGVVILLTFIGAAYPAWRAAKMLPIEAMRTP